MGLQGPCEGGRRGRKPSSVQDHGATINSNEVGLMYGLNNLIIMICVVASVFMFKSDPHYSNRLLIWCAILAIINDKKK